MSPLTISSSLCPLTTHLEILIICYKLLDLLFSKSKLIILSALITIIAVLTLSIALPTPTNVISQQQH